MNRYTLTRRNGGHDLILDGLELGDCGLIVVYTALDSLGLSRSQAAEHGIRAERAFSEGRPYQLDTYRFTTTKENGE